MTDEQEAIRLAGDLVQTWENWSDDNEERSELSLHNALKAVQALDLGQVDGVLASPLNYFVRSCLDDVNPEDLTICEMIESLKISIGILAKSDAEGSFDEVRDPFGLQPFKR